MSVMIKKTWGTGLSFPSNIQNSNLCEVHSVELGNIFLPLSRSPSVFVLWFLTTQKPNTGDCFALCSCYFPKRRGHEGNGLWMQAFFKAVPVILAAVDNLQTVECPGFANWEFPLFDISWRGLLCRSLLHHISHSGLKHVATIER